MIFRKPKIFLRIALLFTTFHSVDLVASPWIWKAEIDNKELIIIGVIHYATQDSSPETGALEQCLSLCSSVDRIYFETLPTDWDANGVRNYLSRKGSLPLGKKLKDILPRKAVESMQAVTARELKSQVEHLQPWNAAAVIYRYRLAENGYTYEASLERQLYRELFAARKKMKGLESPFDQLKALSELPEATEVEFFESAVISDALFKQSIASIFRAWRRGELEEMRSALKQSPFNVEGMDRKLLDERNQSWARSIKKIQRTQKRLAVVVGIEHLVKDDGSLLEQLKSLGYSVTRLR